MIHIFKYNDVLDNKNLDKLTENYEAYEQEISDLKKQIAELQLKLFITNPLTKNKGAR